MTTYNLSAFAGAGAQFFDDNGSPLVGGKLYSYTAGTTTLLTTYTTSAGTVANTNPIILNAGGRTPNEIWQATGILLKFVLYNSLNELIGTYDGIPSINDPFGINSQLTSVAGTNSITATATPTLTAYATGAIYSFIATNTNTGAATLSIDGLTATSITKNGSVALTAGDIQSGKMMLVEYDGTTFQLVNNIVYGGSITNGNIVSLTAPLGASNGGTGVASPTANNVLLANGAAAFQTVAPGSAGNALVSDGTTWVAQGIASSPTAARSKLKVQVTSDTAIAVTADQLVLAATTGAFTLSTVSVSISTSTSGANGLDTGSIANSTWYSVWVIYNVTTTAGLLSASAAAPTLPSGYTYKARVGWVRYATAALARTLQYDSRVQYVVTAATQTLNLPIMASGVAGNTATPTWSAVAWAAYAPSTAGMLFMALGGPNITGVFIAAPNNAYGGVASTSNPPMYLSSGSNYSYGPTLSADMIPESSNVYWASNAAQGFLLCRGWIDNL
jgi:hypothetical protein